MRFSGVFLNFIHISHLWLFYSFLFSMVFNVLYVCCTCPVASSCTFFYLPVVFVASISALPLAFSNPIQICLCSCPCLWSLCRRWETRVCWIMFYPYPLSKRLFVVKHIQISSWKRFLFCFSSYPLSSTLIWAFVFMFLTVLPMYFLHSIFSKRDFSFPKNQKTQLFANFWDWKWNDLHLCSPPEFQRLIIIFNVFGAR